MTIVWEKNPKTLLENILLSKYNILQKYKMFHEVFVSMKISQGKLSRARLKFLGKRKENRKLLPGKV